MRTVALGVLLLGSGCARHQPTPADTLALLASAIEHDDPHAAWLLVARSTRPREEEFARVWRATRPEQAARAEALRAAEAPRQRARVRATDGKIVALAHEPAGWRLIAPGSGESVPATPEEALRRFVDALERRDMETLLALLSDPLRGLVERELSERAAGLRQLLGQKLTIEGDRVRVPYGGRHYLQLERGLSGWRIANFN